MVSEVKPGSAIGEYRILPAINSGGMAYIVMASLNGKVLALKITRVTGKPDLDEQNNTATRKEAHLLSSLNHDRIVKVLPLAHSSNTMRSRENKLYYGRATEISGHPWYFVMEYLSGGTLDKYVRECGPLTVSEATNIVGNVGLGLGYLHSKNIAHNDVKPENVVFREKIRKGAPYDPVLIDFGTAAGVKRFVDEAGSWYVMSPERIRVATGREAPEFASKINPAKADIWSLGILLYQALTNSLPFASSFRKRLTSQILNDIPDPVSKWNKDVPKELDDFVTENCLSKRPEDRPTVREFLDFIYQYSGRGVPAKSIKEGYYGAE